MNKTEHNPLGQPTIDELSISFLTGKISADEYNSRIHNEYPQFTFTALASGTNNNMRQVHLESFLNGMKALGCSLIDLVRNQHIG